MNVTYVPEGLVDRLRVINSGKNIRRKIANIKCHKCPGCGEREEILHSIKEKRVLSIHDNSDKWYKKVDAYECKTCGVKWESEVW